ncbi:MAG: alpha/beta hydrolase [Legionella sp.]|nr:MAG: alpha/beta hydrolase [Legionella sp.]PJD98011.1 MAG: alpha/beta hydrolase [Legionella sp.]
MMTNSNYALKDILHAQLCYQLFITPIHLPLEKKYRHFARMACEFIEAKRSHLIYEDEPRHYVLHHFMPSKKNNGKKILITHGWLSRAAYMVRLIHALYKEGYEIYALDFPAHGEAKGYQLPWTDATAVIHHALNNHGPFYAAIGHSFGGSMLLNTLNLAGQIPQWELKNPIEKAILIASPTQMRSPVNHLARKFKLSGHGYLYLRHLFREQTEIDPSLVRLRHFTTKEAQVNFLCIHGTDDRSISPKESIDFCKEYKQANLCLLQDANHISVLMDKRVEHEACRFLL